MTPEELAYRPAWAAAETSARRQIRPPSPYGSEPSDLSPPGVSPAGPSLTGRPSLGVDDLDSDAFEDPLTGAGAFDAAPRSRLGAFDPGKRGARALAAVAVIVVLVAAFLAWRARPRVDPVVPPVVDSVATDAPFADISGSTAASGPVEVVVAVGGKVRKPGLVQLPPGARVADALKAAGGANPGVDVAPLNLARKVTDGELIMVGVPLPPGAAGPAAPAGPGQPGAGPVNLNTATLADLDTLPGVGPVLAQRILDARDAQGGFKAVADLRKVQGIGTSRFDQLKDLVTV
ncbi:helix-hairpin-helix domain-containing protein [Actinoplanes friuliensis]